MTTININTQAAVDDALVHAHHLVKRAAETAITRHFNDGSYGGTKGIGYELIQKKVEDFLLSEEFQSTIDTAIAEQLSDSVANSVKTLLDSKTRKHLFTNLNTED